MYVYVIRNSATGKVYIGQHKGTNLRQYLQKKFYDAAKGRGGSSRLYNSMRKHAKEVWSIEPLIEGVQTREELDRLERLLIALYDTRNPEVGYNICRGGEGYTGPFTDYMREQWMSGNRAYWKSKSLVGKTFHRLTVESEVPDKRQKGKKLWNCLCSCGSRTIVQTDKLKSGGIKSCGCFHTERQQHRWDTLDLVGEVFGDLTVVAKAGSLKHQRLWTCRCACGGETSVRTNSLKMGNSKRCKRCKQNKHKAQALELRRQGKLLREIAQTLSISMATCSVWCSAKGVAKEVFGGLELPDLL
jgi:hypothetical protein